VIVRFRRDDDEGGDWIEGEGLLDPLLENRSELAAGDLRLLYLGWLLKVQLGGFGEDYEDDDEDLADEDEPPVPTGLRNLSDSLASVARFLKIDNDLIAVAAQVSGPLAPASDDRIADWVAALPASEKDKFLTMVTEGEGAQVEALLVRQFRRETRPVGDAAASTGRTRAACWRARRPARLRVRRPKSAPGRRHERDGPRSRPRCLRAPPGQARQARLRRRQEAPSWLVFEDDDPWLMFGDGFELPDIPRNSELGRTFTLQTNGIVNDRQLAGPGQRRGLRSRCSPARGHPGRGPHRDRSGSGGYRPGGHPKPRNPHRRRRAVPG
jgi:hypothetical protein